MVLLLAAWGVLTLAHATTAMQRALLARQSLQVRLASLTALDSALFPPDLPLLCLTDPLGTQHRSWQPPAADRAELRWRYLGEGVILAEVDVIGAGAARIRHVVWLTPDSLAPSDSAGRCAGRRLRLLGPGAMMARPGE